MAKVGRGKEEEEVKAQDHSREKLVKTYFNKRIDDPLWYDVVWNTDKVSFDQIAMLTVSMIEQKMRQTPENVSGDALPAAFK